MLFSYNWLQSFFEKKLPAPNQLESLIVKHSFEVESLEKAGKDWVFDIAILSNRPDCMAHLGMAREISAFLGLKLNAPKPRLAASKTQAMARSLVSAEIKDPGACSRYSAKVVLNVKTTESPKWMKERLVACGLRPISNIVDAANYVMLETGQPLHVFDYDKLDNGPVKSKTKKIIVRLANVGEEIEALDDKTYKLMPQMLVIADGAGPLVVAGIKGGKRAEIDANTKNIVIEAANFDSRSIRRTSRALGLVTDASLRFEHGLDPNETEIAANRAADLIGQVSGGQVLGGMADVYPKPIKPKKIILSLEKAECLLGRSVQTAQAKKDLESLGFSVRRGSGTNIEVTVPTRRTDVSIPEDLIEEIGRIGGYDKVLAQLPPASVVPAKRNYFWIWKNRAKDILVSAGYTETRNYSFISQKDCDVYGYKCEDLLEVKNPVNLDLRYMRPDILGNLLKSADKNKLEVLKQFEIGKVFGVSKRNEPTKIAGFDKSGDFYAVKGVLETLCRGLGISDYVCLPVGDVDKTGRLFNPKLSAQLMVNGKMAGFLGQISSAICKKAGIKPLVAFELDMEVLGQAATMEINYKPLSMHPEAVRDISIIAGQSEYFRTVRDAIKKAGGKLVKSIEAVDIYQGAGIPEGMKNLVVRVAYQSPVKTLTGEEIDGLQASIMKAIDERGWQIKK